MKRRLDTQVSVWPAITDLMISIVVVAAIASVLGAIKYAERDSIIAERDSIIAERDSIIAERDSIIAERDSIIAQRDSIIAQRDSIATQRPKTRDHILGKIDSLLKKSNLHIEVIKDENVLRLSDDIVNFASGEIDPVDRHKENVGKLAQVLADVVPCYISKSSQTTTTQTPINHNSGDKTYCLNNRDSAYTCDPLDHNSHWRIGTILIEGHTDKKPVREGKYLRFKDNLELSSMRAAEVYRMITNCETSIGTMKNSSGVPVFSTSGYGDMRLADPQDPLSVRNRRIDLRFILERIEGPSLGVDSISVNLFSNSH